MACILPFLLYSCISCGSQAVVAKDTASQSDMVVKEEPLKFDALLQVEENKTTKIRKDINLGGKIVLVPENVTLVASGGVIKNGTLIGNKTMIKGNKTLFDNVRIKGSWDKEDISTDLFVSLDYENSLQDVLALACPDVENTIEIKNGDYWVSARSFQSALEVCSNTTLVIDGTIRLIPNDYKGCYVIQIKNAENVTIKGNGSIVGDKKEHKGIGGEWGHGVNITNSKYVTIKDLSIRNCWGDCIYVGDESLNILIENCTLEDGRRQGISVTSADGVFINDCNITNVYGTAPQHAIDIEPNKGESVDNVRIEKVAIRNCHGGIMSWKPELAFIGNIIIKNCVISDLKVPAPISMQLAKKVTIEDCEVESKADRCVLVQDVEVLTASGNILKCKSNMPIVTKNVKTKNIK